MANISMRVDDEVRDQLESYARATGSSLSDLLRRAIDIMLERDDERPWRRADMPQTLSVLDRHKLVLHHDALALLAEDDYERDWHQRRVRVLQRGYTLEYGDEFQGIEPELSRADCHLVFDILEMFRILQVSFDRLDPDAAATIGEGAKARLSYAGFDFNDSREGRLADYVDFLVSTDRWTEQRDFLEKHDRGNSHAPMLGRYQRMLQVFQPIWKRKLDAPGFSPEQMMLSAQELQTMLDARTSRA